MDVVFFASQDEFRAWLEANHDKQTELIVGFYKKGSGQSGMTYKQGVDQALCYGWIDGISRSIDAGRYTVRFTPRKPKSIWSAVNIKRIGELTALGLMRPPGIKAFETRDPARTNLYSSEQRDEDVKLTDAQEATFRANPGAWDNFQNMTPSYRKTAIWLVISAKQDATREKRLAELIECSARGLRIPSLRRKGDAQG